MIFSFKGRREGATAVRIVYVFESNQLGRLLVGLVYPLGRHTNEGNKTATISFFPNLKINKSWCGFSIPFSPTPMGIEFLITAWRCGIETQDDRVSVNKKKAHRPKWKRRYGQTKTFEYKRIYCTYTRKIVQKPIRTQPNRSLFFSDFSKEQKWRIQCLPARLFFVFFVVCRAERRNVSVEMLDPPRELACVRVLRPSTLFRLISIARLWMGEALFRLPIRKWRREEEKKTSIGAKQSTFLVSCG